MAKIETTCEMCGKVFFRYPSHLKKTNFCSKTCLGKYNSKLFNPSGYKYRSFEKNSERMTEMNRELNPQRMTPETRAKLSEARYGKGDKTPYRKKNGQHVHRMVAEEMLGRPLKPGEVVHHIDGDKYNNSSDNLMVFPSQSAHAEYHVKKGGEAR